MPRSGKKITIQVDPDLKDIIPRFLEIRQEDITSIVSALEDENYKIIVKAGHSMKGAGTGYGFDYITEIGKSIEDAAKEKEAAEIRRCLKKLTVYLENIEIVYRE